MEKIFRFKAKDSKIKPYPLYLENISEGFTVDNMIEIGLNRYMYDFSVDFSLLIL